MQVYGYFFNPNIHPYTEYVKRKETLEKYAGEIGLNMIYDSGYDMEEFIRGVAYRESQRCRMCYTLRLGLAFGPGSPGSQKRRI